jgi:hypothetical protein
VLGNPEFLTKRRCGDEKQDLENCGPHSANRSVCRLVCIPARAAFLPNANGGSAPQTLESGTFHSVLHPTQGTATIYRFADGGRMIRFTNFKTSNGPDVHIYMVAAADATDHASVPRAGFIDLGSIKGNIGDQNYALAPEVDLSKYRTVSVWCKRFSVNFGAAPLTPDEAGARGQHADSTEN